MFTNTVTVLVFISEGKNKSISATTKQLYLVINNSKMQASHYCKGCICMRAHIDM